MAKRKYRDLFPPFTAMFWEVLDSMAYHSLNYSARAALIDFFRKVKSGPKNPLRYQTEFAFSFKEALKLGYSKNTFSSVIKELTEVGFLDPSKKGSLRNHKGGGYSKFRLSERWRFYGTDRFIKIRWNEFRNPNQ